MSETRANYNTGNTGGRSEPMPVEQALTLAVLVLEWELENTPRDNKLWRGDCEQAAATLRGLVKSYQKMSTFREVEP